MHLPVDISGQSRRCFLVRSTAQERKHNYAQKFESYGWYKTTRCHSACLWPIYSPLTETNAPTVSYNPLLPPPLLSLQSVSPPHAPKNTPKVSTLTWRLSARLRCFSAGWRAGELRLVCGGERLSCALLPAPLKSLHWSNRRSVRLMGPDVTPPITSPSTQQPLLHLFPDFVWTVGGNISTLCPGHRKRKRRFKSHRKKTKTKSHFSASAQRESVFCFPLLLLFEIDI